MFGSKSRSACSPKRGLLLGPISLFWATLSPLVGSDRLEQPVPAALISQSNQFLVSFALGEKAVAAAEAARLPATILEAIAAAPRYAEGRGVRIAVTNARLVPALTTLAHIKHQH